MRRHSLLTLVFSLSVVLGLSACSSGPRKSVAKTRKNGAKDKDVGLTETPKIQGKTPILAQALIYRIDPARETEKGYNCMIHVSKMVRGSLESHQTKFYIVLRSPKRSFPWIKDSEYEGSTVYLHMKTKRGTVHIVGISELEKGPAIPLN
jgi:hypothetical protein